MGTDAPTDGLFTVATPLPPVVGDLVVGILAIDLDFKADDVDALVPFCGCVTDDRFCGNASQIDGKMAYRSAMKK
jgi:hypothetical protein